MDTLETLLLQLSKTKEQAEHIYAEVAFEEEYEPDFDGEDTLWLGLQLDRDGMWSCGWLVRIDELTDWAVVERGATATMAAMALLENMKATP